VPKYRTLINAAQKHSCTFCNSYIPQAAIDMQRIHVMLNACSHNAHSLLISLRYKRLKLYVDNSGHPMECFPRCCYYRRCKSFLSV